MLTMEERIYGIWSNPKVKSFSIEKFVVDDIEKFGGLEGVELDRVINRVFNVTDVYNEQSTDWYEAVMEIVDKYCVEVVKDENN